MNILFRHLSKTSEFFYSLNTVIVLIPRDKIFSPVSMGVEGLRDCSPHLALVPINPPVLVTSTRSTTSALIYISSSVFSRRNAVYNFENLRQLLLVTKPTFVRKFIDQQ